MSGRSGFVFAALALTLAAAAPAGAGAPDKQTLTVTNAASRLVECTVVVDTKARQFLKLHPGKAWAADFDPRRRVQLVCERSKPDVFVVKAGSAYRLEDAGNRWVALAEAAQ
jgi:ABC-type glycerol-3-phosphate transport system substrate-binding protein